MTKTHIRNLRLVVGAAQWEASGQAISDEYADQVTAARAEIERARGPDVVAAVIACQLAGLTLSMDFRPTVRETGEPPPGTSQGRIAFRSASR